MAQQAFAKNKQTESSFVIGIKPVLELIEQNPKQADIVYIRKGRQGQEFVDLLELCRKNKVRFSLLDTEAFERIYSGKSQGVIARIFSSGFVEYDELLEDLGAAPLPLLVFLDQVQDSGNVGTLVRTMYALGVAGYVIPKHNGVALNHAATRAAAGAMERLPVAKVANMGQALDKAKELGISIYGAAAVGSKESYEKKPTMPSNFSIYDASLQLPAILLLGGEEGGVRLHHLKRCDALLHIPMQREFDSLNVAQAGAILLSWFAYTAQQKNS